MEPVAIFSSPFSEKFGIPRQSGLAPRLKGEVRLCGKYRNPDALRGLEEFDYIWLIWGFSANPEPDEWSPTVRPPRLGGNRRVGVFASRSPFRPNSLGLSAVRLESVDFDNLVLHVRGADLMDGTPVCDIKPYVPYADAHADAKAGFVDAAGWRSLEVVIPEEMASLFSEDELDALKSSLSLDPRPRYKEDGAEKKYGLAFAGRNISFIVSDGALTVIEVS